MRKGTIGLSNSEMAEFRRCRRRWYLHHYRRLAKRALDAPGSAVSIGNYVHDALAAYYDLEDPINPVTYAETALELSIEKFPAREADFRKEFEMVRIMLSGYLEWLAETGADSDITVTGSEQIVRVPLRSNGEQIVLPNGEPLVLLSKLDAPVERKRDDHRLALEHKTTDTLEAPIAGYRINSQFLTEHLARFLDYMEQGADADEAMYYNQGVLVNLLKKSKQTARANPPFYNRVDVMHNLDELRTHWRHVVTIAGEIATAENRLNAGESHHEVCPPTPIPDRCKWECEFFKVCALANDGSDFEGALEGLYEERDPLERYGEDHEAL